MKVLMLNGSPHDSGVNDLALREMEAGTTSRKRTHKIDKF